MDNPSGAGPSTSTTTPARPPPFSRLQLAAALIEYDGIHNASDSAILSPYKRDESGLFGLKQEDGSRDQWDRMMREGRDKGKGRMRVMSNASMLDLDDAREEMEEEEDDEEEERLTADWGLEGYMKKLGEKKLGDSRDKEKRKERGSKSLRSEDLVNRPRALSSAASGDAFQRPESVARSDGGIMNRGRKSFSSSIGLRSELGLEDRLKDKAGVEDGRDDVTGGEGERLGPRPLKSEAGSGGGIMNRSRKSFVSMSGSLNGLQQQTDQDLARRRDSTSTSLYKLETGSVAGISESGGGILNRGRKSYISISGSIGNALPQTENDWENPRNRVSSSMDRLETRSLPDVLDRAQETSFRRFIPNPRYDPSKDIAQGSGFRSTELARMGGGGGGGGRLRATSMFLDPTLRLSVDLDSRIGTGTEMRTGDLVASMNNQARLRTLSGNLSLAPARSDLAMGASTAMTVGELSEDGDGMDSSSRRASVVLSNFGDFSSTRPPSALSYGTRNPNYRHSRNLSTTTSVLLAGGAGDRNSYALEKPAQFTSRFDPKLQDLVKQEMDKDRPRFPNALNPKVLVMPAPLKDRPWVDLEPPEDELEADEEGEDEEEWEEEKLELPVERRPAGTLYGRSLMDILNEKKAAQKAKVSRHIVDTRRKPMMELPQSTSHRSLVFQPDGRASMIFPSKPTLSVPEAHSDNLPSPSSSNSKNQIRKSVFGPDLVMQRELEKLEKILVEEKEEEEKMREDILKKMEKKQGKGRRGKGKNQIDRSPQLQHEPLDDEGFETLEAPPRLELEIPAESLNDPGPKVRDSTVPSRNPYPQLELPRGVISPDKKPLVKMESWFASPPSSPTSSSSEVEHLASPPSHPNHLSTLRPLSDLRHHSLLGGKIQTVKGLSARRLEDEEEDEKPLSNLMHRSRKSIVPDIMGVSTSDTADFIGATEREEEGENWKLDLNFGGDSPAKGGKERMEKKDGPHEDDDDDDDRPLARRAPPGAPLPTISHTNPAGGESDDDDDVPLAAKGGRSATMSSQMPPSPSMPMPPFQLGMPMGMASPLQMSMPMTMPIPSPYFGGMTLSPYSAPSFLPPLPSSNDHGGDDEEDEDVPLAQRFAQGFARSPTSQAPPQLPSGSMARQPSSAENGANADEDDDEDVPLGQRHPLARQRQEDDEEDLPLGFKHPQAAMNRAVQPQALSGIYPFAGAGGIPFPMMGQPSPHLMNMAQPYPFIPQQPMHFGQVPGFQRPEMFQQDDEDPGAEFMSPLDGAGAQDDKMLASIDRWRREVSLEASSRTVS